MLDKLIKFLTKKLYRLLIYRTIMLNGQSAAHYHKLPSFCTIAMPTNKGDFNFLFKKDRRAKKRGEVKFPNFSSYIVQLETPKNLETINDCILNVVVVIVTISLFKTNYEVLTEVLAESYIDTILENIPLNQKKTN